MRIARPSSLAPSLALAACAGLALQAAAADPPPRDKPAAKSPPPVTIMVVGNRLVVTSDDPQALITRVPSTEGDFEVIPLQNASAADLAKVLDEAFNGPRQPATPPGGPGRRGLPPAPSNPRPDRIRVVADAGTNSLLVRASPLDMLAIRRLLARSLDGGETDSRGLVRTWLIPVRHASAGSNERGGASRAQAQRSRSSWTKAAVRSREVG